MDYKNEPLDVDFLINAGILFEMNKQFLHCLGIKLIARVNPQSGEKELALKDMRHEPEKCVFDDKTFDAGTKKYSEMTRAWGFEQVNIRQEKLGWGTQYCHVRKESASENQIS